MSVTSSFKISLNDIAFYARIGVFPQERTVGNEFRLDLEVTYDASDFKHETLESTISYADIYEIAKECMSAEYLLLESVAKDITGRISERWSNINQISTSIRKVNPPIPGITGNCGVEYFWKKS